MVPRTAKQFEELRESRRLQIMESAMELFAREGYGHVSIASLAKHAGISKGLLYNYFDSKEELLKEIIDSGIEEIMTYFDPNDDGKLTTQEFTLFIRKTFELMHENKDYWLKLFGIIIQPNVSKFLKESSIVKFMQQYFEMFESYFKEQGFEDPALEVLNLSILIEGMGIMMLFYDDIAEIPQELFTKLEDRIVKSYTTKI
jgi:AcrR family transcriptional regulator